MLCNIGILYFEDQLCLLNYDPHNTQPIVVPGYYKPMKLRKSGTDNKCFIILFREEKVYFLCTLFIALGNSDEPFYFAGLAKCHKKELDHYL